VKAETCTEVLSIDVINRRNSPLPTRGRQRSWQNPSGRHPFQPDRRNTTRILDRENQCRASLLIPTYAAAIRLFVFDAIYKSPAVSEANEELGKIRMRKF